MRDSKGRFIKGSKAPKTAFKKGSSPWNKGTIGLMHNCWKGKKFSEEHKNNISIGRIRFFKNNGPGSHPGWKGGIKIRREGYILIRRPKHPSCDSQGYILEHRFICESYIGRYLTKEEVVHHINEIKNDNRICNLIVFINASAHTRFHSNPNNVKSEEIIFDGRNYHV